MNLLLFFITIICSALVKITNSYLFIIPIIFFSIILVYRKKYKFCLLVFALFTVSLLIPLKPIYVLEENVTNYVVKISKKASSYYIVIDKNNISHYLYLDEELDVGSKIMLNGKIERLKNETLPLVFNFSFYMQTQGVATKITAETYEIIYNKITFKTNFINNLLSPLSTKSQGFIRLLIFGQKSKLNSSLYDDLVDVSAVHLFVVSGFHFKMLFLVLDKILKFKIKKEVKRETIIYPILLFYLYLLDFSIASTRAFLFMLFRYLNKLLFDGRYSRVEILSMIGIIMVVVNPYVIYSLSFILCFTVSFVIEFIGGIKQMKFKSLLTPLLLLLASIPIILKINYEYNVLGLIINFILTLPTSIFYFASLIVMIFPYLDKIFLPMIIGFEYLVSLIANIPTTIIFGKVENWFIITYYLIFVLVLILMKLKLVKKVYLPLSSILLLLVAQYYSPYFMYYEAIHFIDVGQGDCILVRGAYNSYNIMIDTGGNKNYDLATKRLIPYLKALGIKKLDALILSHNDFDHSGAKDSLVNNYKVSKIVESNQYEQLNFKSLTLTNINNSISCNDGNDCSSVLYFKVGTFNVLLTGDISTSIEREIMKNYNSLPVDILKVSHHGSNTSTSGEFLDYINPSIAIIQVGTNFYGHPHKDVINRLEERNIKTFIGKNDGSVIIKVFKSKLNIYSYKP
jgi:competence protein ComEC